MEEIKAPKKERKFLKAVGNIAKVLANELVMGIARKFIGKAIDKVGNKRQGLSMALIIIASTFAIAQYPNTGNKQRLGFQTTGDGLVWRGALSDTASIQPINNQNAWVILDTVNLKMYSFDFTSNVWNLVGGGGGAAFTQPVDSLFFNVNVPTNNVDTAKMRWDSDLATVVLGLNDNVPNEIGFKNFWLVKNQTGTTITKGSLVYANGTVGASGRITVAKFIANGSIDAKYLLGITAHDLTDGEDGYVISYGKIRQVNTDTFAAGAILYPSPTVAGVWTDVEPVAPNIDMPIGFCINSHVNNGTIAIRVASGYKLSELHDVSITSPVENSSLYYKNGLWRDTTAALLTSDTASMLLPYLRDADTVTLSNRINLKLNIADTSAFARDNQISGTSGQVAYFNSSSSVVSDTALRWSAANKSLGINVTSVPSGANLILKNSQEPVRSTVVATQTFGADTTNWTRGAGWTFNGTQAVATAATGDLTYTPALTITSGNAYEILYTITNYSAGTLTVSVGNATYSLPLQNANLNLVLLLPTSATGGFRFTTSTFTGNLDNVRVVQISNPAPTLLAGQDDNSTTLYPILTTPNNSSISLIGGGKYSTALNNVFIGENTGNLNTGGDSNNFIGYNAGRNNTNGRLNNFLGNEAGQNNTIGSANNFFGSQAGASNTTGLNNNFFGSKAGLSNTTGGFNNFFGASAGQNNTVGGQNNFFGDRAGRDNTTGSDNNFFGILAGVLNTGGSRNNFFGSQAGFNNQASDNNFFGRDAGFSNTTGSSHIMIGNFSGRENITGTENIFIGRSSARFNKTGNYNITMGLESGYYLRSGSFNIFLGDNSGTQNEGDTLSGSNNIAIGKNAANNISGAAAGNVAIGNAVNLPTNNSSNQGVYQNVLFFTGASGTGTTIAAASKAGIKTNAPNRDLEVAGEVRITDLTTDAPTRLVGADADGDLGQVTLGAGLSLASSSLLADTNFLVTRFDTASMLTNYLRTGTAASTYLPLTGGTLSGNLGVTGNTAIGLTTASNKFHVNSENIGTGSINWIAGNFGGLSGDRVVTGILNGKATIGGHNNALNAWADFILNQEGGNVGINTATPSFKLDVNGTTGLQGALTVNSSAVFNEAATDSDFRVESEANANMLFVDASTSRVGIGYASPTKTLDVNGEVRINTVTATPTSLLGKDGSNVVGNVTLGSSLTLSSGTLNVTATGTFTTTNSDYTIVSTDKYIAFNNNFSNITVTLPSASDNTGRELHFRNVAAGSIISASNNVINDTVTTGTPDNSILGAGNTNYKWCTLVSNGTYWIKMQAN